MEKEKHVYTYGDFTLYICSPDIYRNDILKVPKKMYKRLDEFDHAYTWQNTFSSVLSLRTAITSKTVDDNLDQVNIIDRAFVTDFEDMTGILIRHAMQVYQINPSDTLNKRVRIVNKKLMSDKIHSISIKLPEVGNIDVDKYILAIEYRKNFYFLDYNAELQDNILKWFKSKHDDLGESTGKVYTLTVKKTKYTDNSVKFSDVPVKWYFMYKDNLYIKLKVNHALRLSDLVSFSSIVKERLDSQNLFVELIGPNCIIDEL